MSNLHKKKQIDGDQVGAEDPHRETLVRVALYCRVSTEEQGNRGYSLRQQLEVLREYCQQNKYEIVGEFEDRVSGGYPERI
jgi:predicted site-specific integrase-resolvase